MYLACPKILMDQIGYNQICARVPETYLKALFSIIMFNKLLV